MRAKNVVKQMTISGSEDETALLLILSGSASQASRSEKLAEYVAKRCAGDMLEVKHLKVRDLPSDALLNSQTSEPQIATAISLVEAADAIIVATPVYKGSFSGLLKAFLDVLPQYALRGKLILPLVVGGTSAHVLMLDYALRPVLQTMWPRHIAQGCFVLDSHINSDESGNMVLASASAAILDEVIDAFRAALRINNIHRRAAVAEGDQIE